MIHYVFIFGLLLVGFGIMFQRRRWLELAGNVMRRTIEGVDEAARKRLLENRRRLLMLRQEHSVWYRLEQELNYSGWKRRFPFLTPEVWLISNGLAGAVIFFGLLLLSGKWWVACLGVICAGGVEYLLLHISKAAEARSVNNNLLSFLNFLGNYSITAGEVTGIFNQISKYVDEPMKSALDECCYEAKTTGDSGLALLAMAEKIEHPKFKEIVHNLEVSIRYCADFKVLVDSSRRSVREYLRLEEDRKGMLTEALVNMAMLLVMSVFALLTVDGLIDRSVWEILFRTVPGWIALGILGVIFLLMTRQMLGMYK